MQTKPKNTIYGRHPVVDALKSGVSVDKVYLQQGTRGALEKELRLLCRNLRIPLQMVPKEKLNALVKGNHQGVVALIAPIQFQRLEDIIPFIYERSEIPLLLLLDGITDVRNFGAIARSAEICGAHALVVGRKKSAQINAEAIKSSAGALANIAVCRESSIEEAIRFLQMSGIKVLASDLSATQPIYEFDLKEPVALIVGAEGSGVSSAAVRQSDEALIIPQLGKTDSFNVSVAAGIMLYEAMRQRTTIKTRD